MLSCGLLAGTEIALVVGIDAVGDGIEPVGFAVAFEDGEQLILTVKTAHGIVAGVSGVPQFLCFHNFAGNSAVAGEGKRVGKMSTREARGIGDYREHRGAQCLVCRPGEKGGIDAARVRDDQALVAGEVLAQAAGFLVQGWLGVHDKDLSSRVFALTGNLQHGTPAACGVA